MNRPVYYGGIGILHASPGRRRARLSRVFGNVVTILKASLRRRSNLHAEPEPYQLDPR
jgi:hypothetical protein